MTTNFWAELPKPFFILAPMEDVTDVVFRHVVQTAGASQMSSYPPPPPLRFTNSDSYCHPDGIESVRGRLTFHRRRATDRRPYFGGDKPEFFRQMSIGMAEMGFKGIDGINMGCPVPNVAGRGKGSGLILRPDPDCGGLS